MLELANCGLDADWCTPTAGASPPIRLPQDAAPTTWSRRFLRFQKSNCWLHTFAYFPRKIGFAPSKFALVLMAQLFPVAGVHLEWNFLPPLPHQLFQLHLFCWRTAAANSVARPLLGSTFRLWAVAVLLNRYRDQLSATHGTGSVVQPRGEQLSTAHRLPRPQTRERHGSEVQE